MVHQFVNIDRDPLALDLTNEGAPRSGAPLHRFVHPVSNGQA